MTLRTVLLIALGSFLAGLAVCLRDHRLPLVLAESAAFFAAAPGVLAYARASGREAAKDNPSIHSADGHCPRPPPRRTP